MQEDPPKVYLNNTEYDILLDNNINHAKIESFISNTSKDIANIGISTHFFDGIVEEKIINEPNEIDNGFYDVFEIKINNNIFHLANIIYYEIKTIKKQIEYDLINIKNRPKHDMLKNYLDYLNNHELINSHDYEYVCNIVFCPQYLKEKLLNNVKNLSFTILGGLAKSIDESFFRRYLGNTLKTRTSDIWCTFQKVSSFYFEIDKIESRYLQLYKKIFDHTMQKFKVSYVDAFSDPQKFKIYYWDRNR